jgi:hypothetical protein
MKLFVGAKALVDIEDKDLACDIKDLLLKVLG